MLKYKYYLQLISSFGSSIKLVIKIPSVLGSSIKRVVKAIGVHGKEYKVLATNPSMQAE